MKSCLVIVLVCAIFEITSALNPVDGSWSDWTSWTSCSKSCGGGIRSRERSCASPPPSNRGKYCAGASSEVDPCNLKQCPPICKTPISIAVIADASSSINSVEYGKIKDFIGKLTESFAVGEDKSHFAMIKFSFMPVLEFNFADRKYWDPVELKKKIAASKILYGTTNTNRALQMADEKVFCDTCGIRPDVPKVLVVITDGKSTTGSLGKAAQPLKDKNVTVMTLGIGRDVNRDELLEMATDEDHVFLADDFDNLVDQLHKISNFSCYTHCDFVADINYIADSSTSVTHVNFEKMKRFIVELTYAFKVGEDLSHFSLLRYSFFALMDFTFAERQYWTPSKLRAKIMSSQYLYGGSRVDLGMKMAKDQVFCKGCGARVDYPHVVVVISDGRSSASDDQLHKASKELKDLGTTVISFGVGNNVQVEELKKIASDDTCVFLAKEYKQMVVKINQLAKMVCTRDGESRGPLIG